ncbi:MAG: hypothetical protein ACWA5R_08570 [bacterium]
MKKISLSLQILIILLLSCSANSLASGFRLDAQIQQHLETHNEVPVIITMKENGPSKGFSDRAKLMNQLSVSSRVIRQNALTPDPDLGNNLSSSQSVISSSCIIQ